MLSIQDEGYKLETGEEQEKSIQVKPFLRTNQRSNLINILNLFKTLSAGSPPLKSEDPRLKGL